MFAPFKAMKEVEDEDYEFQDVLRASGAELTVATKRKHSLTQLPLGCVKHGSGCTCVIPSTQRAVGHIKRSGSINHLMQCPSLHTLVRPSGVLPSCPYSTDEASSRQVRAVPWYCCFLLPSFSALKAELFGAREQAEFQAVHDVLYPLTCKPVFWPSVVRLLQATISR